MKKLELNKMGLAPMNEIEMQVIEGGGIIKDSVVGWLVGKALETLCDRSTWDKIGNCLALGIPQGPSASRFY